MSTIEQLPTIETERPRPMRQSPQKTALFQRRDQSVNAGF